MRRVSWKWLEAQGAQIQQECLNGTRELVFATPADSVRIPCEFGEWEVHYDCRMGFWPAPDVDVCMGAIISWSP